MNTAALIVVLCLIAADVLVGVIAAFATGSFQSGEMRQGLVRKCGTLLLVLVAFGLQLATFYYPELPAELAIVFDGVAIYISFMEISSILENILKINPELSGNRIFSLFGSGKNEDNN